MLEVFNTRHGPFADDKRFHAWYSETPGGPVLEGGERTRCNIWLQEARGAFRWTQNPAEQDYVSSCYLGPDERTLYLNLEVCSDTQTSCDVAAGRTGRYDFDLTPTYAP